MQIMNKKAIELQLPTFHALMELMQQCYIDYSDNKYTVPPVGHMPLPNGELHIKYGIGSPHKFAAIKIASGSYTNYKFGLPNSYGCILVINSETGFPEYLLQDEGVLTDHRTAAAGALIASKIAERDDSIAFGIIGCGEQGYYQSLYTTQALGVRSVYAYDIDSNSLDKLKVRLAEHDIDVVCCESVKMLCEVCDVITTVTPSKQGYINYEWLKPNAHINAFGCDSVGKQELMKNVIDNASLILADSLLQCSHHGELQYSYRDREDRTIKHKTVEVGTFLKNRSSYITNGVTIADFTGIAPQDIAIANSVV